MALTGASTDFTENVSQSGSYGVPHAQSAERTLCQPRTGMEACVDMCTGACTWTSASTCTDIFMDICTDM